jgi:hypothetical protein
LSEWTGEFVTTTVKGNGRQAPDLVERNFAAAAPDLLWVEQDRYLLIRVPGLNT